MSDKPHLQRLPGTPDPDRFWTGVDGLLLAGDSWGDTTAPLVMLAHGGGQTRHAWKGAGERLAKLGYYVIAFDARGHGDSQWSPDGSYGDNVMARDLKCIVETTGKAKPVLVGASMGGLASLVAAGSGLIDAGALVLVDIAPQIEFEGVYKIRQFMTQNLHEGYDSLEEVSNAIASYQPQRRRSSNLEGLAKNLRLDSNGRYRWHWDPSFMKPLQDLAARREMFERCARNITVPTLLVRGALSDILSETGVAEFRKLCPQAEYVNVADAGHMVAGDRNDVFADAVLDFLIRTVHPAQ